MAYEEFSAYNGTVATSMFEYVGDIVPIFYPFFLFTIFIIITFLIYSREKTLTGRSNILLNMVVAGWTTTIFAILLSLINIVDIFTVVVCIIITVTLILISFVSKDK